MESNVILQAKSTGDLLLKLCQTLTEANIAKVLLPQVDSNQKLQQALKILSQERQGQLAFNTLEAVRRAGKIPLTAPNYVVALSSCAKSKLWKQALALLFESMPKAQIQPNVISYNAAISACEKGGRWQEALTLFEAMTKAQIQPTVISYNAAVSACEKGGRWQEALTLFDAMPKAKVQPDVISYSAAISACEKGGQWQQALSLTPCPKLKFSRMSSATVRPSVPVRRADDGRKH